MDPRLTLESGEAIAAERRADADSSRRGIRAGRRKRASRGARGRLSRALSQRRTAAA